MGDKRLAENIEYKAVEKGKLGNSFRVATCVWKGGTEAYHVGLVLGKVPVQKRGIKATKSGYLGL